jgi:hypothetical protein
MNNQQLQLVTYKQAKRLKEAGFDWLTYHYYSSIKELCCNQSFQNFNDNGIWSISAPTVALALKWFRDEKGVFGNIIGAYCDGKEFYWNEVFINNEWVENQNFDSYEDVESNLLDRLLSMYYEKDKITNIYRIEII